MALYAGDWALVQLWLFWLAPILGGIIGTLSYRVINSKQRVEEMAETNITV